MTLLPSHRVMNFTTSWHTRFAPLWRDAVLPLLPDRPWRWLELGSYEGQSACWVIDNAGEEAFEIVCVDMWPWPEIEQRFDANVAGRVTKFKERHTPFLLRQIAEGSRYDVIYIDGDHNAPAVLSDSVLGWQLLHPGGVMIWDDYCWRDKPWRLGRLPPDRAIDGFLSCHLTELQVIHHGEQVIVRRNCQ